MNKTIKFDAAEMGALLNLAKMEHSPHASPELQAVAAFVARVILPKTSRANSDEARQARRALLNRGAAAALTRLRDRQPEVF